MSKLLYLAQPVDLAGTGDWQMAADLVAEEAARRGWVVYRPLRAFHISGKPNADVYAANMRVLQGAAGVIAMMPRGVNSVGVPAEVQYALGEDKKVLVLHEGTVNWHAAGWDAHGNVVVLQDTTWTIEPDAWRWLESGDFQNRPETLKDKVARVRAQIQPTRISGVTNGAAGGLPGQRVAGPTIKFVKLNNSAEWPSKAHADDAGWDLYVSEHTVIPAGSFVDVPSGIACEPPEGTWVMLTGRSSTLRKRGLLVNQGVIDYGYRGELFAGVWNMSRQDVIVEVGERLAQLICVGMPGETSKRAVELAAHDRGLAGFGSSGK